MQYSRIGGFAWEAEKKICLGTECQLGKIKKSIIDEVFHSARLFREPQLNAPPGSQQYQPFPLTPRGSLGDYVLGGPFDPHSDARSALSPGTVACLSARVAGFHFSDSDHPSILLCKIPRAVDTDRAAV